MMSTEPSSKGSNFIPLVINFAQREMAARYKRSLLGWLWSLLNPASTVLIYSLVFGVFLRTQPPVAAYIHERVRDVIVSGGENGALADRLPVAARDRALLFRRTSIGEMSWLPRAI